MTQDTLAKMFWNRVERSGGNPAQQAKRDGVWKTQTWKEVGEAVRELAAGLIALGRRKGDAVGILSASRAEWVQADFAIFSAGCVTIPIYPSYPPDLIQYIVNDAGLKTLIVEDPGQLAKVLEVQGKMDGLEQIVVIQGHEGKEPLPRIMTWDHLRRLGREKHESLKSEMASRVADGRPDGRRDHRLYLGHHRPAQGRGANPRQPHGGAGRRRPDHDDRGGRRPPPVLAARALLCPAGVVHRHPPRAHHWVRGEHRQAARQPARGATALHLQRAAGVREGVRRRARQGGGGLAPEEEDLPLGGRSGEGDLPAQAGGQAHSRGARLQGAPRPQARLLEDARRARRPPAVRGVGRGAAVARDRRVFPRRRDPDPGGVRPHRDLSGAHQQPRGPLQVRLGRSAAALGGDQDRARRGDPRPGPQHRARLLQEAGGHRGGVPPRRLVRAPATSDASTRTASSSSRIGRRTSSSPREA